ncbi:MAG TPA: glutathione S-transferase N-terminal domain-containing protein [Alphaproteobacteria bacterium]|jgi:GST-like protein|nr:glutathione S-transferase N-terminal domain-containing protein [Alphaproteobacteria bacterium]
MITLYTWTTPNGRKASIGLEETGLPYEVRPVNIGKDEQFSPEFLKVSPNNKIPAIVDHDVKGSPIAIFESGAILIYLAEKSGKLLPASGPTRFKTLEWLFWQVGGPGPMFGQLGFFAVRSKEKSELAIKRFAEEADRLLGVMDKRLGETEFLGGNEFTIADIATYPWTQAAATFLKDVLADSLTAKPNIHRWLKTVGDRPAVQRGMKIPEV